MVYATEETPLGTAGSVLNAREELDERFLVISGDVLTDIDLSAVVDFHDGKGALATLALCAVENPLEFGIVIVDEDGAVERFLEKPTWGQVFSDTINTGIYVLEPEIFDFIPEGRPVDFSSEVFPAVLAAGRRSSGTWPTATGRTSGPPRPTSRPTRTSSTARCRCEIEGFPLRPGVWLGKGSTVDPERDRRRPGDHRRQLLDRAGAVLGEYTTSGSNVRVAEGAEVRRSVVSDNGYLGAGVQRGGRGRGALVRPAPGRALRARVGARARGA